VLSNACANSGAGKANDAKGMGSVALISAFRGHGDLCKSANEN
jgi:hypothetical protein